MKTERNFSAKDVSVTIKNLACRLKNEGVNPTHVVMHPIAKAAIELEIMKDRLFFSAGNIHGLEILVRSDIPESLVQVFDESVVDIYTMLTQEVKA
jgi:hypothetical protein